MYSELISDKQINKKSIPMAHLGAPRQSWGAMWEGDVRGVWFFRQEYCSGWPFPSPGVLSKPGIEPESPSLQVVLYHLSHIWISGQITFLGMATMFCHNKQVQDTPNYHRWPRDQPAEGLPERFLPLPVGQTIGSQIWVWRDASFKLKSTLVPQMHLGSCREPVPVQCCPWILSH